MHHRRFVHDLHANTPQVHVILLSLLRQRSMVCSTRSRKHMILITICSVLSAFSRLHDPSISTVHSTSTCAFSGRSQRGNILCQKDSRARSRPGILGYLFRWVFFLMLKGVNLAHWSPWWCKWVLVCASLSLWKYFIRCCTSRHHVSVCNNYYVPGGRVSTFWTEHDRRGVNVVKLSCCDYGKCASWFKNTTDVRTQSLKQFL